MGAYFVIFKQFEACHVFSKTFIVIKQYAVNTE